MKSKKKILAMAIALLLICTVGGTLAWLTARTTDVTNTFTTSDIGVGLAETTGSEYKMIPGYEIDKDPKAWIKSGSEDAYLFVKVEKSANFDTFMTCTINTVDWTELEDAAGTATNGNPYKVYYRVVAKDANGENNAKYILESDADGKEISVLETVTKEMMNNLTSMPTLTFTAYAHQLYSDEDGTTFNALEAWNNVKNLSAPQTTA